MDMCLILLHHKGTGIISSYNDLRRTVPFYPMHLMVRKKMEPKISVFKNPITIVSSTKILSLKELHCHI